MLYFVYVRVFICCKDCLNMLLSDDIIRSALNESLDELEVYHGSKAEFEKFDLAYLSSGWGHQLHGYGIYLTDSRDCAEEYSSGGYIYTVEIPSGRYLSGNRISPRLAMDIAEKFFYYCMNENEYLKEAYEGHERDFWETECKCIGECADGEYVYGTIETILGDDKETSEFLYSIGFKGLKYRQEYSRGKFYNYVIFNTKDIKILGREGE